ncbi:unnamed protein product [Schistosoma rodhaini]|uniref:ATP synthase subunit s, mitochondrial n=1 Tax=Schistosoma rodhaini TaxID=6188 RepID=A0A183QYT5_9TREM|nr:unnamed protein product [Schistosoma rodhaini]
MFLRVTVGRLSKSIISRHNLLIRYASSEPADEQGGFTRSVYSKPKYKHVVRDGKSVKIYTGLVAEAFNPADKYRELLQKAWSRETLTVDSLRTLLLSRMRERNRQKQIISDKEVENLGLDVAIAHMVCRLGGRVQLIGHTNWIQPYAGIPPILPNKHVDSFVIETIDLSGTNIVYEGLEFLPCLTHLRYLKMKRCVHLDDFCLSRIGRIKGLQFLDVSECPTITSKGLATLAQLKALRRLIVSGNPQIEDKELVCLLLEDHLPKLYIDGVDYIGQLPDKSKEKILRLVSTNEKYTQAQNEETNTDKVYLIDKA